MTDQDAEAEASVQVYRRRAASLYPTRRTDDEGLLTLLTKAQDDEKESSAQAVSTGRKELPFNIWQVLNFLNCNPHHARSLMAKSEAMVGLGFVPESEMQDVDPLDPQGLSQSKPAKRKERSKVSKELDPLCQISFQDVLNIVAQEFCATGNGYIEVVRDGDDPNGAIRGLYHMPAAHPRINIENSAYDLHYEVRSTGATRERSEIGHRIFAKFGDLERVLADTKLKSKAQGQDRIAELIPFRIPSSFSRWYGYPQWFSAVPSIEVSQALHQYYQDFFLNRGVPEFMLFAIGKKIAKKSWEAIDEALKAQIGLTNSHKSLAVNIECNPDELKIQIEKLAMESQTDAKAFKEMADTLSLEIVSAHGVPPLLAGIQIPGKLGATNELPNALMAFQLLCVGPLQTLMSSTLECTLGNPDINGGLALGEGDFVFRAITDELNLQAMDTMSRMRDPAMGQEGQDRDLNEGLQKEDVLEIFKDKDVASKAFANLILTLCGKAA